MLRDNYLVPRSTTQVKDTDVDWLSSNCIPSRDLTALHLTRGIVFGAVQLELWYDFYSVPHGDFSVRTSTADNRDGNDKDEGAAGVAFSRRIIRTAHVEVGLAPPTADEYPTHVRVCLAVPIPDAARMPES